MDIEGLKNKIILYCENRPDIMVCYLFGSYTTGANRPGSDLDIAFLLDVTVPAVTYNEVRFSLIGELGRLCRLDIHPLIMNTAGELVHSQVFRKGICIFQRDAEAIRSFRRRKLPLIVEFSYYVDMMRSKLKQRHGGQDYG